MSDYGPEFHNPFAAPPLPPSYRSTRPPVPPRTSGKALASLLLGILGFLFWIFAAIPAIVLGLLARSEIKAEPQRYTGRALANLGVLLGVLGIIVPAVAVPLLIRGVFEGAPGMSLPRTARVVHFHLSGPVVEQPFEEVPSFFGPVGLSFKGLIDRLDRAREDDSVKAVVLTVESPYFGFAQVEELWKAFKALKDAGKPVYAHAADLDTLSYALLSSVSKINVVPTDEIWLIGLRMQNLYLADALEKIGVKAEVLHAGDYKAAGEMLSNTGPSEAASENMNWLIDGLYDKTVELIAEGRELEPGAVRALIDQGPFEADRALEAGLIDSVSYRDEFLDEVRAAHDDIYFDNHYLNDPQKREGAFGSIARARAGDTIALIYAEGTIVRGYQQISPFGSSGGMVYSADMLRTLELVTDNYDISAVVLRIDSPGGSAVASEEILRGVELVRGAGIPVVVSMGSTAASGGYYIACTADAIFADASTITASIGVVGGKIATEEMWGELGVNWHTWQRGRNAGLLGFVEPFTAEERESLDRYMAETYDAFKAHVNEGRGAKLTKPLEDMAGGRVYTGAQALELGLVDEIGGLREAIERAAELADLESGEYSVKVLPEYMGFWEAFLAAMRGEESSATDIAVSAAPKLPELKLPGANGIEDPRVEALSQLAPAESRAFMRALNIARMLGEERVLAVMPELIVAR